MNILHGPLCSYYTAKTRAYLSYKHIPFVETHDIAAYRNRVVPALGFTVFPVLEISEGEFLQDTTVIIDELEGRNPSRPAFPEDPVLMLVTRIVEFFIDELWVVTAMHTRWNDPRARRFAFEEFNQYFGTGNEKEHWSNGDIVAEQMQNHIPGLGIDSASGQQVMQRLFEEATQLLNQAVGPRQFAFGPRPGLVDCCLYTGYFAHQYRDDGSAQRYLKSQAPALSYFIDKMHAAYSTPATGYLELTEVFLNYLQYIGPIGASYATSVMALAQPIVEAAEPGEELKQVLWPEIELFGQKYKRNCTIFSAWKAQRVKDAYVGLSDDNKKEATELMTLIGWRDFLLTPSSTRIERVGFSLQRSN